ncbi:uncharacterized protein LOC133901530 [Phragmites australis]|uniref:uncharacterized protein LOC133901530 n=1 Tax=Phragmites australis TaxID=29695 RepID=UPI002D793FE4|nr:uncharacterized protein LOC133901530 [Phragmites australis]
MESNGIDVILKMEWLSNIDGVIEWARRAVHLTSGDGTKVEFVATTPAAEDCSLNLLEENSIDQIRVVRAFPDVFSDELPDVEATTMEVDCTLEKDIHKGQLEDEMIKEIRQLIKDDKAPGFTKDNQGIAWFRKRICVPNQKAVKELISREAHDPANSIHPESTQMYQDLKDCYWKYGIKRDVAEYIALCVTCQKVKAEH